MVRKRCFSPVIHKIQAFLNELSLYSARVISQRMYLSLWFGILMGSASCSSPDKKPSGPDSKSLAAEADVLQDNPLAKRLNRPSSMPSTPFIGVRISWLILDKNSLFT